MTWGSLGTRVLTHPQMTSDDSTRMKHWPQAQYRKRSPLGPLLMESAQPRPLETAGGFVVAGFATDLRASTQQCATGAASTQSCRGGKNRGFGWFLLGKKHGKPMVSRGNHSIPSGYVKIAIENGPFIVSFPIKNGDFPWLC